MSTVICSYLTHQLHVSITRGNACKLRENIPTSASDCQVQAPASTSNLAAGCKLKSKLDLSSKLKSKLKAQVVALRVALGLRAAEQQAEGTTLPSPVSARNCWAEGKHCVCWQHSSAIVPAQLS